MKKTIIAALVATATLGLGTAAVMAADVPVNTDSKTDQKPMDSGTAGPTPGWEKLQKNKHFKSAGGENSDTEHTGATTSQSGPMKTESKIAPETKDKP